MKPKHKVRYVGTSTSITVHVTSPDGRVSTITCTKAEDPEKFDHVRKLMLAEDTDGIIAMALGEAEVIPEYSMGLFSVDHTRREITDIETGTRIHGLLAKRIVEWAKSGQPFEPLLRFHRKAVQNPSKDSAADLYQFLDANNIPVTQHGDFIGYKMVTRNDAGELWDTHSRTIRNDVGSRVTMPREGVDPNRNNTCSTGLHVGGYSYASSFSGNTLVEVLVDPRDVVAVPPDYNNSKMRTCGYTVLRQMKQEDKPHVGVLVNVSQVSKKEASRGYRVDKAPDWSTMTAQAIKDHVRQAYGVTIDIDNKNKQAIVKRANAVFLERGMKSGVVADPGKEPDWSSMTAQAIKDYVRENYGTEIHTDNKNKQTIIRKAQAAYKALTQDDNAVRKDVLKRVTDVIVDSIGVLRDEVLPESSLMNDLGMDDLDWVECIMTLEREFNLAIPDDDAEKMATVSDVVDYIIKNTKP